MGRAGTIGAGSVARAGQVTAATRAGDSEFGGTRMGALNAKMLHRVGAGARFGRQIHLRRALCPITLGPIGLFGTALVVLNRFSLSFTARRASSAGVFGSRRLRRVAAAALLLAAGIGLPGCAHHRTSRPMESILQSPYRNVRTWVVAPVINLSGSRWFDPLTVSDELFGELQQVQSLNVLPVNKTLMAMERLRMGQINSAKSAAKIAELLHADGIVVAAITAYDAYNPPTVGMDIQMYSVRSIEKAAPGAPIEPVAQVSAIFNAANRSVRTELRNYAAGRKGSDKVLGTRRYLLDSNAYMRFVCHAMIQRLLVQVQLARSVGR